MPQSFLSRALGRYDVHVWEADAATPQKQVRAKA